MKGERTDAGLAVGGQRGRARVGRAGRPGKPVASLRTRDGAPNEAKRKRPGLRGGGEARALGEACAGEGAGRGEPLSRRHFGGPASRPVGGRPAGGGGPGGRLGGVASARPPGVRRSQHQQGIHGDGRDEQQHGRSSLSASGLFRWRSFAWTRPGPEKFRDLSRDSPGPVPEYRRRTRRDRVANPLDPRFLEGGVDDLPDGADGPISFTDGETVGSLSRAVSTFSPGSR